MPHHKQDQRRRWVRARRLARHPATLLLAYLIFFLGLAHLCSRTVWIDYTGWQLTSRLAGYIGGLTSGAAGVGFALLWKTANSARRSSMKTRIRRSFRHGIPTAGFIFLSLPILLALALIP